MSDIFQLANIGLIDGARRLEAISLNAANASLPGYRRHVISGSAFAATLAAAGAEEPAHLGAPVFADRAGLQEQRVNVKAGSFTATGRALDLAIDADDLYFALTDGTRTWLTRGGAFQVDERGLLTGERGLHVLGVDGEVQLPGTDVTVETDGRVTHQGVTVATLHLFRPSDPASLTAAEGALLVSAAGMQPAEPDAVSLRSGTLEASNTDAGREMLSLMAVSRQFESLSRVLQGYDAQLGRLIQMVGGG
jgi:flagellar basal body rod protein FlgG